MRNLKRALSLTLASVMLLGMMVVGSSAASYPDVDDNDNVEAIEVLQAVQVMRGDDKGNFNPDSPVTRSEMAVIMALLLNLDYQYYEATCPFNDVPSWARPYVGACYANKIVSGYDANTYGSNDGVTPVQAASMLMRALGYFKYDVDYSDGFETATVRQGTSIGIFDGVGSSASAAMTRNQVAQMALNALQCGMVEPSDNSFSITTPDGFTVAQGRTNYVYVVSRDVTVGNAINQTQANSGNANSGLTGPILDLGEQLYNGNLKLNANDVDDFGRPARTWQLKTEVIGTYTKKTELIQSWDTKVTKTMIYDTLGKGNVDNLKASNNGEIDNVDDLRNVLYVYEDGVLDSRTGTKALTTSNAVHFADRNNTGKIGDDSTTSSVDEGTTGNGSRTELYMDKDGNVSIVVVNTYVVQAASDYNESKKELRVASAGDTSEFIRLDNYTLSGEDFDLAAVKEDDYLLVTVADTNGDNKYEPQTVEPAEIISGKITAFSDKNNVSVDGEKYSYSFRTLGDGVKSLVTTTGGNVALVMDKSGYIIAVDDTIVGGNYVFITGTGRTIAGLTAADVVAKAYFSDGSEDVITLKKVDGSSSKTTLEAAAGWYTYSKDSSDKYTLTSPRGSYASGYNLNAAVGTPALSSNKLLVSGRPYLYEITGANGTTANGTVNADSIRANERTVFVIVDKDGDVATATGISEAPEVEVTANTYQIGYVWNDKSEYATFVFIGLEGNASSSVTANESSEFIYVMEADETLQDEESTYYTYKTIRENAETTIEAEDDGYKDWTLYTKVKINGDNERIIGMKEVVNSPAAAGQTDSAKWRVETPSGDKVVCEGKTLIIGDESYVINGDTRLHMVVDKDAGIPNLKVNTDEDADYVVYDDVSGSDLRATLDGFTIYGEYYAILEKDYVSNKNNVLDYLFLHVTSVGDSHSSDEAAAATALAALDDGSLPGTIIPAGEENDADKATAALKRYIQKEIDRVTKNVSVKVEWPANSNYTAPTPGTADDPAGTPGAYNNVKVTISKEDGTEQVVTLSFTVDGRPYNFTVEEVGEAIDDNVTPANLFDKNAELGDSKLPGEYENTEAGEREMMNDIADRYAEEAEKILEDGIAPAAEVEDTRDPSSRTLSNGMVLKFTWGAVTVPTQPTSANDQGAADGSAVITKLELVSADGETRKTVGETINVTVPALPFEKTEAGKVDAALEAASDAITAAASQNGDLKDALTVMNTQDGYAQNDTTIPGADIKAAAEAVIADTAAADGVTVKSVATKVTTAVNGQTDGAFEATITLAYEGTEKAMSAITGVITPYVDPAAEAALSAAKTAIEGMTAADLTFENNSYTTSSHAGLDTAVQDAVDAVVTSEDITATVTVTVTQAATDGDTSNANGTDGAFSISVALAYSKDGVTANETATNAKGVITATAFNG